MSKKDYYQLLGIQKNASADEIKKAYRKLAMKHHPDQNQGNPDAEKKFKEISEAYDILKDTQKRAAYDQYGHAAFDGAGGMGRAAGAGGGGFDASGNFSDIFSDLFGDFMGGGRGAGGQRAAKVRGADLRYNLEISLEDAFKGKKEKIKFTTAASCDACHGSGSREGASATNCTTCGGSGRVRMQQGFFTIEKTCTSCHGMGQVIKNPCGSCSGEGRTRKEKILSVVVPEGVENGTRIRLAGEGEVGFRGGAPGDLYIFIKIKEHQFFIRDGQDIHCKVPIKMVTAALGGEIHVPVIDGTKAKVSIPSGTQNNDKFRLKGKGMVVMKSGGRRGDMYIHSVVETPVKLTRKQKELLQEFDSLDGRGTHPESEKFMNKVKTIWADLTD